jgi:hypothetical protein
MRRPDGNQPAKGTLLQRCSLVADILEFLTKCGARDVRGTTINVVIIMKRKQFPDPSNIAARPSRTR